LLSPATVQARPPIDAAWKANARIDDLRVVSDGQFGAAQGVSYRRDRLYFYGDVYEAKPRVRTLIFQPHSELEGWLRQPDGREVFVTSSPKDNIYVGKSRPAPSFSTPAGTKGFSER
jgi:hypothetical protein